MQTQMNLTDLIRWHHRDAAIREGAKIPWDDEDFSHRMLANHLAQDHDWASRRKELINQHAAWISRQLKPASRILDLSCGPGLYTHALAEAGHACVGVDFSPASIEYARQRAEQSALPLEYVLSDIRQYRTDQRFDAIIMTFGEFNVFTRNDAKRLLENCAGTLNQNGLFVLEAHTYEAVQAIGEASATWQRQPSGLFSEKPHLCLQENAWDSETSTVLSRFFIVDAASADVRQYASFMQAYKPEAYREMLHASGLLHENMLGRDAWPVGEDFDGKLQVFVCRKR